MDERPSDMPEELHLAAIDVLAVDFRLSNRNSVAFRRPGLAVIIAVLEDEVSKGIDPGRRAAVDLLHLLELITIVVVEDVDSPRGHLQRGNVGSLRRAGRLDVDQGRPGPAEIRAARADDVLAVIAFLAGSGGDDAEPRAVVAFYDVRLVGIRLIGDHPPGFDVAPAGRNLLRLGHSRGEQHGEERDNGEGAGTGLH